MDTIIPIYFVEYTVFIEDIFKIIILAYLFYSIALWHILQKHIPQFKVTDVSLFYIIDLLSTFFYMILDYLICLLKIF